MVAATTIEQDAEKWRDMIFGMSEEQAKDAEAPDRVDEVRDEVAELAD